MKYLIDTQILIWFQLNSNNLSEVVRSILLDLKNEIFVSQVTLFELAIKQKIGKLPELDISIEQLVSLIEQDNFEILFIKNEHISGYNKLELIPDHRDPFDRLIIATAIEENIKVISSDEKFKNYHSLIHLIENK